jgi:hypothetical protein
MTLINSSDAAESAGPVVQGQFDNVWCHAEPL